MDDKSLKTKAKLFLGWEIAMSTKRNSLQYVRLKAVIALRFMMRF
tara:strand:+ start:156 stop:290 length:135 start_codon:yes stop_codon:yes gene_type:complete